jgi:hypothetical protein
MPEGQGYQSGLIAALRGSSPNDAPTTQGIQFMPNELRAQLSPINFNAPRMSGNLMTSPSMSRLPFPLRAKSIAPPSPDYAGATNSPGKSMAPPPPDYAGAAISRGKGMAPPPPNYTGAINSQAIALRENADAQNFANQSDKSTPFGLPPGQQPFVPPSMTGNLMPAPDMPRAPDYVPPPPPPAPVQPPAPQINYEMDDEGNRTGAIIGVGPDGEPYRYFPSFS